MAEASIGLVLDCVDPVALADFWSKASGFKPAGVWGAYAVLISTTGSNQKLLLQRVEEPKIGKNRMHLDIEVADVEAEVTRLEAIGARRAEGGSMTELGMCWVVMLDPEGNEFCVCDGGMTA